jgi:hypothetical protein
MTDRPRPLTGRELNEQHKALVESGASSAFTLRWLRDETDLWCLDRATGDDQP